MVELWLERGWGGVSEHAVRRAELSIDIPPVRGWADLNIFIEQLFVSAPGECLCAYFGNNELALNWGCLRKHMINLCYTCVAWQQIPITTERSSVGFGPCTLGERKSKPILQSRIKSIWTKTSALNARYVVRGLMHIQCSTRKVKPKSRMVWWRQSLTCRWYRHVVFGPSEWRGFSRTPWPLPRNQNSHILFVFTYVGDWMSTKFTSTYIYFRKV